MILRFRFLLLPIALMTALISTPADAGFQINIVTTPVLGGSSNDTFQVTLTNTGAAPVMLDGFAFRLIAGGGLTFTAVDTATTPAYLFAGQSAFGPDISNGITASFLNAEDNAANLGVSLGVGAGATVGLGDVHFNVSSGVTGPISITVDPSSATNFASNGADVTNKYGANTFNAGSVIVNSAVPEPSTMALTGMALAALFGYRAAIHRAAFTRILRGVGCL